MGNTIADRLREYEVGDDWACWGCLLAEIMGDDECSCPEDTGGRITCYVCYERQLRKLADAIEAEQRSDLKGILSDKKPQLPEGIEWPRFEDGELVRFGDEFDHVEGYRNIPVEGITFSANGWVDVFQEGGICQPLRPGETVKRPEPEVLDADGVPIKVGEILYDMEGYELKVTGLVDGLVAYESDWNCKVSGNMLTHRKPDTFKSVVEEMLTDFDSHDTIELDGYLARLRKLLGGE